MSNHSFACRVTWHSVRDDELYLYIADNGPRGWEFAERSSWEIAWTTLASTPELVQLAENLSLEQEGKLRRNSPDASDGVHSDHPSHDFVMA